MTCAPPSPLPQVSVPAALRAQSDIVAPHEERLAQDADESRWCYNGIKPTAYLASELFRQRLAQRLADGKVILQPENAILMNLSAAAPAARFLICKAMLGASAETHGWRLALPGSSLAGTLTSKTRYCFGSGCRREQRNLRDDWKVMCSYQSCSRLHAPACCSCMRCAAGRPCGSTCFDGFRCFDGALIGVAAVAEQ